MVAPDEVIAFRNDLRPEVVVAAVIRLHVVVAQLLSDAVDVCVPVGQVWQSRDVFA